MSRSLKYGLLLLAGLLILTGAGIVPINLFFAKDAIRATVRQNLGVELEIHGSLKLRLGLRPQLSASELRLHAPGARDQPLLAVSRLSIYPVLFNLIKGDIHLRSLNASGVFIDYCPDSFPQRSQGTTEEGAVDGDGPSFAVQKLKLDRVRLDCDRPEQTLSFVPEKLDLEASSGKSQAMNLRVRGDLEGQTIELSTRLGSLDDLMSDPPDFPLQLHLNAFDSVIDVNGVIQTPLSQPVLNAQIEIESRDPAVLLAQAGISAPALEPLQLAIQGKARKDEVELKAVKGRLGEARFSLSGRVSGLPERPYFELQAQLPQLDLDKLPAGTAAESSTANWREISLVPLVNPLQQFDAAIQIEIPSILGTSLSMENLVISARLKQGELVLDQAELKLAGSPVSARAGLNLQAKCLELVSDLQLSEFDLDLLNHFLDEDRKVGGRLNQAHITTTSCGDTLGEHADSLGMTGHFRQAKPIYQDVDLPLTFSSLAIEMGQKVPGRLALDGILFEEKLAVEMTVGPLADLFSETPSPVKITATGADSRLQLEGNAAFIDGGPRLDIQLNLDIARLGALHPWIGFAPDSPLAGKASTRLHFSEAGWSLEEVDLRLGQSNLRGSLARTFNEHGPLLKAKLDSDLLEMSELAGLIPESGDDGSPVAATVEPDTIIDDEWIAKWFSLPSVDFELDARRIAGIDLNVNSVHVVGRVREHLIEDSHLSLNFEGVDIAGNINMDLRSKPWKLAYRVTADQLDIGHLLAQFELADDVSMNAEHLELNLVSEGQSIRDLFVQSRLEAHVDELIWTGGQQPGEDPAHELLLRQVDFTTRPSSPTYWSANGILNEVPVRLWMRTPSIAETLDNHQKLPLRLALEAGQDVMIIEAIIDRQADEIFRADLSVSGQRMNLEGIEISDLQPPLDDYELATRISLRQGTLDLADLEARLGASKMAGQVKAQARGKLIHFDARLDSPFIETEDFVSWVARWRSVVEKDAREEVTDSEMEDHSEGFITVLNRELDELTRDYSFDLAVAVENLYSAGNFLGEAEMRLTADEKELHLSPFRITHPNRHIDAEYHGMYVEEGLEARLKIHAESLEYGGLLRLFDSDSKASGLLYLDTSLVATAPDWPQLTSALQGHLDLLTIPDDFQAGFLDLWASNLIFSLLRTTTTSGSDKKMNCLVTRLEVEDGVMSSKNILLDSTDIIVHGRGSIDLGKRQLDLLFAPQAKVEKFLSVSAPIEVKGPFDDFRIGVTRGGFVMTLFRWYMNLIYVPYKWLTGERFPADGLATCYRAMDWDPDDIRLDAGESRASSAEQAADQ